MEEVKKGFKAFLQSAQIYVWAGLIIVSAITFVYTKGYKASGKDSGNAAVIVDVKTIKENQDSMLLRLDRLIISQGKTNTKLDAYAAAHNALQKSYKTYLQDNIKYSKVLMPYVDGLIELQKKSEFINQIQNPIPYNRNLILTSK
jgi:hypothetical protein